MNSKSNKIRVGISIGDYNGIGPEIILKSLKDKTITDFFTPIIFGSGKLFSYQKNIFKLQFNFNYISQASDAVDGRLNIVNLRKDDMPVNFGTPTEESTKLAIDSLEAATNALIKGEIDVLVTAPINKDEMIKHGFSYTGHTEYLEKTFNKKGLMFMVSEELKVAVSTHHIPISNVAKNITKERIIEQVRLMNDCLKQDFSIQKPKIAILGLNPHSGDNGTIGKEEIEIIQPAIKELFDEGILVFGAYPADSFFQPNKYQAFDGILAMYHDQGLAPFKTIAYEDGVNYTAGMPFVRTSPDHGVAYDIAGKNLANEKSFIEAIFTALKIYKNRTENIELLVNQLKPKFISSNNIDEDLPDDENE